MAVSNVIKERQVPGASPVLKCEVTLDTSYPTGGYAITAATFGLTILDWCIPVALGPAVNATADKIAWDEANQKVLLYSGTTQVSNAVDVSAFKVYFYVKGK